MRRTPAEWERHERTFVAWPTRPAVWQGLMQQAADEYTFIVQLISKHEPVLIICRAEQRRGIEDRLAGHLIEFLIHPIDDGWVRDNGPILVEDNGHPIAVDFAFNSWGDRFIPFDGDASIGIAISSALQVDLEEIPFVLEGGAISWNGSGIALVSRECVLHPSRNGEVAEGVVEDLLARYLGIREVIWVPYGLLEDLKNTDGHVDNVAVFISEDTVLAQACPVDNPNFERLSHNIDVLRNHRLEGGGRLEVVECEQLPYARMPDGTLQPSPYLNLCFTNGGGVILPSVDSVLDQWAVEFFGSLFTDRDLSFAPSVALTFGGGGPHCITMQWPHL